MNWIWIVGAPLVRTVMAVLLRVRIEGIEHVPRHGAVLIAPNHVSVLDGPALSAVTGAHRRRPIRSLIAAEIFHGLRGWILRQAHQIPIRRGSGDSGALDDAAEALRAGTCVGVFPEGRVNEDPDTGIQRLRSGLTRLAIPTGTPVVPVGIWGTQTVWPQDGLVRSSLRRRPRVALVFGSPVVPAPEGLEAPAEFRARFLEALRDQVARAQALVGDRR
jgi:1-acyl-sn-glycerol-3-phosphate acyltransferase